MSVLQILTKDEIKNFESAPKFDLLAKNHFFKMTDALNHMTMEMKNDSNKILFILMYGYFKATNKFFDIQNLYQLMLQLFHLSYLIDLKL